jgi:uncharacterized RDD family membrane protein YckC
VCRRSGPTTAATAPAAKPDQQRWWWWLAGLARIVFAGFVSGAQTAIHVNLNKMTAIDHEPPQLAGLARRLAAMFYDSLILVALFMFVTAALLIFTGGDGIPRGNRYYQALLLAIIVFFFIGFWVTKGRTLGMLAWRLRVERNDGSHMSFKHAALRLIGATLSLACAGLGYLWMYADSHQRTWHDRLSDSRIVVTPRKK